MERFTLLVTDFEKTVDVGQEELKEKDEFLRVKNEELLELKVFFTLAIFIFIFKNIFVKCGISIIIKFLRVISYLLN
jgi:hypothetical protein